MPSVEICEVTSSPVFGAAAAGSAFDSVPSVKLKRATGVRCAMPSPPVTNGTTRRGARGCQRSPPSAYRAGMRAVPTTSTASVDANVVTVDATCGCDVDGVRSLIRPRCRTRAVQVRRVRLLQRPNLRRSRATRWTRHSPRTRRSLRCSRVQPAQTTAKRGRGY